jgi:hypothetical protein
MKWIKFSDEMPPLDIIVLATNGKTIHMIENCWPEGSKNPHIFCHCNTCCDSCLNWEFPDTHWGYLPELSHAI